MNYLEQLTYGEANRVVSGYSHLSGERAYDASMMAVQIINIVVRWFLHCSITL
jgi:hypothetical protein